jgi:hypothetical protein
MKNSVSKAMRAAAFILPISLGVLCLYAVVAAQSAAPRYKFDPDWPKPLPNKWKIGGITGLAVDKNDDVWVLNRPNDLTDIELHAELTPPAADCCVRPPAMIHIDKNGNVIGSFDAPQGHGMDVDSQGFIYIGQDTVRKYDRLARWSARCLAPETQGGGPPGGRAPPTRAGTRWCRAGGRLPRTRWRHRGERRGGSWQCRAFRAKVSRVDSDDRRRRRGDPDR